MVQQNSLGNATLGTKVDLSGLQKGLKQGEQVTTQSTGKMGTAFSNFQGKVQGAARQVPIFGEQLAAMATPAGVATLAMGGLTTALVGSITKITSMERELRPMMARSGLAAESLQVLTKAAERLGSEDGLEGVTDSAQELQLRLAEAVQDGTGPAVAAFEKLGLASEDLIEKSPEEMLLAVITALQNVTNEADKKFLADELLGGSSEKLAGILAAESDAFQRLTADIRENADIVSNEAIVSAAELDREMAKLKGTVGSVQTAIGSALIPEINNLVGEFEDWKTEMGEDLEWWRRFPGVVEQWVTGIDNTTHAVADLGDGFEDMATEVVAASGTAFDRRKQGSFPYMVDDGMDTAVEAVQNSSQVIIDNITDMHQRMVEANRARLSREEQMEARRAELRKERNEKQAARNAELERQEEEHTEEVEEIYDEHIRVMSESQTEYHLKWAEAQATAYENRRQAQTAHYNQIAADTGIHLSNILRMYQASGVSGDFSDVLSALDAQTAQMVGTGQVNTNTALHRFVFNADLDDYAGTGHLALSYDEHGRYVGANRGTHDVHGRDESGGRTGIDTLYRLYSDGRLPVLPGMGDPTGGVSGAPANAMTTAEWEAYLASLTPEQRSQLQHAADAVANVNTVDVMAGRRTGQGGAIFPMDRELGINIGRSWLYANTDAREMSQSRRWPAISWLADQLVAQFGGQEFRKPHDESWRQAQPGLWRAIRGIWEGRDSSITGFQRGGIAMNPMRAILGEAGAEAVIPLNRMDDVMTAYMRAQRGMGKAYMGGGMGGGMAAPTIIVHVNEGAYVFEDFVSEVQDALLDAERRGIV